MRTKIEVWLDSGEKMIEYYAIGNFGIDFTELPIKDGEILVEGFKVEFKTRPINDIPHTIKS